MSEEGGAGGPRPLEDAQGDPHGGMHAGMHGEPHGGMQAGMHGEPYAGVHGGMNAGMHGEPQGLPPLSVPAPAAPAKSGSMKPILGLLALAVVSAALCAGVVFYLRNRDAPKDQPAAEGAPEGSAMPAVEIKTVRAVVTLPEGQPRGVLRQKPEFNAPVVVMLPAGTAVEVTNSTAVQGQTWYRVRTVEYQPAASGWMHAGILKMN